MTTSAIQGPVVSEILPGVFHCKQDLAPIFPGTWAAINIVVGERLAVIDTGLPGGQTLIWSVLEFLGRPRTDVVAILNTHFHGDHTGSNGPLRSKSHGRIMIHREDAPWLGSGKLEGPSAGPADVELEDGSCVHLGDRELRIVHLPGHTPGSIGVYLPDEKALFTGDSLQARGTAVQYIASYSDPEAYVASVRRVLDIEVEHLVPGHAFAPFDDSHLHGADVQRFLDISLGHSIELNQLIASLVLDTHGPVEPTYLAARVCANFGFSTVSPMAVGTIEAHLKRML